MKILYFIILGFVVWAAWSVWQDQNPHSDNYPSYKDKNLSGYNEATFAGGCFWCIESTFDGTEDVVEAVSGYTGGQTDNPSYTDVSSDLSGHREAVKVYYDADKVSYDQLLNLFWTSIDPTDSGGQFTDRGYQYTTAIYYHDAEQKEQAETSKKSLAESDKFDEDILTEILAAQKFWPAEDYHQDYAKKQSLEYKLYYSGSGRKGFVERTWGNLKDKARQGIVCLFGDCQDKASGQ